MICCAATAVIPVAAEPRGRRASLRSDERRLHRWIIEQFAREGRVGFAQARAAAWRLGLDLERALERLAGLDLVHRGDDEIAVAYPFSGRPTPHRVWIDGQTQPVFAMCAIDALGIAPVLKRSVEILSRDPLSGREVWVRIDPGDGAWWEPATAVVLYAYRAHRGPSFRRCCGVVNFFASRENALAYLLARPELSGHPITLPEAIDAGAAAFADLLEEARPDAHGDRP